MKALFSHDGIFTLTNMLSSDIPNLLDIDVGAHLWDDANLWNKYAPSSYTHVSHAFSLSLLPPHLPQLPAIH